MEANGNAAAAQFLRKDLDASIMRCMVDIFKAAQPKLTRKRGYFDLFGCDFMVTTDNRLMLLEINTNPALSLGKNPIL